jgi:hypothetical protein
VSRPTPYELTIGEDLENRFPIVRAEAQAGGKDATDPAQFASLPTVQRILTDIESPELLAEHPEAAAEYLALLYAAFRFWEAGKVVCEVTREDWSGRDLARGSQLPEIPSGACYLQLSERWFWAQIDEAAPHEPLDGMFVAQSADGQLLVVIAVLGLRPERGGFSQVSLTVARDDLTQANFATGGPLFAPAMDGGAEAGVRSVSSAADLLLLVQLALTQATR